MIILHLQLLQLYHTYTYTYLVQFDIIYFFKTKKIIG